MKISRLFGVLVQKSAAAELLGALARLTPKQLETVPRLIQGINEFRE